MRIRLIRFGEYSWLWLELSLTDPLEQNGRKVDARGLRTPNHPCREPGNAVLEHRATSCRLPEYNGEHRQRQQRVEEGDEEEKYCEDGILRFLWALRLSHNLGSGLLNIPTLLRYVILLQRNSYGSPVRDIYKSDDPERRRYPPISVLQHFT